MERQVHRLEKLLQDKDQTIRSLTSRTLELEKQVAALTQELSLAKAKADDHFSYHSVPDREVMQTLEAKLAASAWQVLQLQRTNMRHQEHILRLQREVLVQENQLNVKKYQLESQSQGAHTESRLIEEVESGYSVKQWEENIREKQALIEQNLKLRNKVKSLQSVQVEKLSFYLQQVTNLSVKIKNQHQNEKAKLADYQNIVKELRKQIEELRKLLQNKNEQLLIYYQQTQLVPSDKSCLMHTIRNLRAQLRQKSQQFCQVLQKLQEVQQLKNKLCEYSATCSQNLGEFHKLAQKYEQTSRQNGILKEKLQLEAQKLDKLQGTLQQANKKLHELLIENEACHELLYQFRGNSNIFSQDIEEKVSKFMDELEKRRECGDVWLDVSELVQVNQKMRMQAGYEEAYC